LAKELIHVLGLSSPNEVSREAQKLLDKSEFLAGPERLLDFFPDFDGVKLPLKGPLRPWLQEIEILSQKCSVLVLASGDPNFFGVAQQLMTVLDPAKVCLWPGATMVQKAFALMKKSWAGVETVSLHGRASWREFWAAVYRANQKGGYLAVYTDPRNSPAVLAEALSSRGQDHLTMLVFEDLATNKEKMTSLSLSAAAQGSFSPLNLVVLATDGAQRVILGSPEEAYDPERGLITKRETRLVALGLLELTGQETLWDLGAGCGSVAVEAARLLEDGEIWALEKNPERVARIKANQRRFGLAHLSVVAGQAPEDLGQLPDPDRIFVGGGGEDLADILSEAQKRLRPGGVIVAATIDPNHLATATRILSSGPVPEVTQLSAARSQALGPGYYLKPLSPIWLVKGGAI
jgi:precorrin-6Y C5,15-methyltransferase (decarboxylating)